MIYSLSDNEDELPPSAAAAAAAAEEDLPPSAAAAKRTPIKTQGTTLTEDSIKLVTKIGFSLDEYNEMNRKGQQEMQMFF